MGKLTPNQIEALEDAEDICQRADAMGLGLCHFPVETVRELTAALRRSALSNANQAQEGED